MKDAGSLTLEQIGARLDDLTRRAREGQLTPKDVSGGSFTISNHGVSGSLLAAPIIIHQGQAAILGVGKLEKRVVVREVDGEDAIVILPMAYVTLTIDHRVVDGHQTNAWLSRFVECWRTGRRPSRASAPRFREQQKPDHQAQRGKRHRVPQAAVDISARGDDREGRRRQEPAEPAVADMIGQRHRRVADARRE